MPWMMIACVLLVWTTTPAAAFNNNGFETDWAYAIKTSDSSLVALRESDGAVMATLLPPVDLSDPSVPSWMSLTFAGTPANNDARLFIIQDFPRQVGEINQHPKNIRIAEIDASGTILKSVNLSSLLPGSPAQVGTYVRPCNIRYSSFHRSLFLSIDRDYRDDTLPGTIYEIDLELTAIKNTYNHSNVHHDESCIDINPYNGMIYVTEFNLGQPDRSILPENGQGDLIAIDTSRGSTNKFRVLIDGPTYAAQDSRWLNPHCPVWRGVQNPSGRPTLLVLSSGPTVAAWPQLEFFADLVDGQHPPAGNLKLRASPYTSQRFGWRGQLDEITGNVLATRLNASGNLAGIDIIAPDDTTRRIGTNAGWQDVDSPGAANPPPLPALPAGMPQVDPLDGFRFVRDGQPWYPAGYYPGLGSMSIRGPGQTREAFYTALMDKQAANGINYFRTVFSMGQALRWGTNVQTLPYQVTGTRTLVDGANTYTIPVVNLDTFNDEHFAYWRGVIEYARAKGIVVQLCIQESWHNNRFRRTGEEHEWGQRFDFYAPDNNVNGLALTTENEWHDVNPSSAVWQRHTAMVREVVDRLGDLPNIVWEVCNEPRPYYDGKDPAETGKTPNNWTFLLGAYLKEYERTSRGYNHAVMPIDVPDHQHVAGQKPDYWATTGTTETDGHTPAGTHRDLLADINSMPAAQPLITDNDAPNSELDPHGRRQKAWAALTAGGHIDYFHYLMSDLDVLASQDVTDGMRYVGYTAKFIKDLGVNLRGMSPSDGLVTSGWCYARSGQEYVIYLTAGGGTTVANLPATYHAAWFNPRTGTSQLAGGGPTFTAPDNNDWVLHISTQAQPVQAPFRGSAAPLSGRIEAEDYDLGGEGIAYHDATAGNSGAEYRDDDVDIQTTTDEGGGQNVGWINAGEWLEYSVNVATDGFYDLGLRVAADPAWCPSIQFHVELDAADITGPQSVPPTSGWQDFRTTTVSRVEMRPGLQVLRVAMDADNWNLNWIEAALVAPIVSSDLDRDGDVDQVDFGLFQACYTGLLQPVAGGCEAADLDHTGSVDVFDFNQFQTCLSGPNQPPGC